MNIYYENGCFSLWSIESLETMPKTVARKIAKMIGNNQYRDENEECIRAFCDWLIEKIVFLKAKLTADTTDKATMKQLKFYISLSEVI